MVRTNPSGLSSWYPSFITWKRQDVGRRYIDISYDLVPKSRYVVGISREIEEITPRLIVVVHNDDKRSWVAMEGFVLPVVSETCS